MAAAPHGAGMSSASKTERDTCPLCGKPTVAAHKPFCGPGCRDRDLLNWLGDAYRVPGPPAEGHEEGLDREPEAPL